MLRIGRTPRSKSQSGGAYSPSAGGLGDGEPADPGGPNSNYPWKFDFSHAAVASYNSTSYPNLYTDSSNNGALSIVAGRSGNALKVTVPAGGEFDIPLHGPSPGAVVLGDATMLSAGFSAFNASDALAVQFWFKATGTIDDVGCKWLEIWGNDSERVQFSISDGLWRLGPNSCGSNGWGSPSNIGEQPVGPTPTAGIFDNTWRRCTIYLKPNTTGSSGSLSAYSPASIPLSSRDGRAAMWIDGTKIMDVSSSTIGITPSGGSHSWCTGPMVDTIPTSKREYIKFPDVFVGGSVDAFTITYDDLILIRNP